MEAKGEISMRMVHCEDCGKRYDYDVDGFCPRCGDREAPAGTGRKSPSGRDGHGPAAEGAVPRSTAARRGLVSARQQSKGGNICEEDFLRFVRQTV